MNIAKDIENLPTGWTIAALGDHLERITNGLTVNQETEPPGIPVSRIETISDGTINFDKVRYVRDIDKQKREQYLLKSGDILFSHINSDLHLGKTAIYSSNRPLLHGMNLLLLRTRKETLDPYYLHYLLNLYRKQGFFIKIAQHAVNQSSLNQKKITSLKMPLAPLPQQHLIVSEIEKQFSRLDEAVAALKRIKANLKRYKASVLKAAVEGKLTEEWRRANKTKIIPENMGDMFNSKRVLNYNEICKHADKNGEPKPKKPTNIDTKFSLDEAVLNIMPKIPKEWHYVHIAFITANAPDSIVDGPFGSSINVKKDYTEFGIPVIRINNIAPFKFINDNLKYLRKIKFEKLKRHNIVPGDILFSKVGTIGNSCIYPKGMQEGMLSTTGSCRIRVDDALYHEEFLCLILNSLKPIFNRIASAGVQPFLNMETIKNFPVPLLNLIEQEKIVKRVDVLFSVAERIETHVDKGLLRAERLRQAILKKAFSGRLC